MKIFMASLKLTVFFLGFNFFVFVCSFVCLFGDERFITVL